MYRLLNLGKINLKQLHNVSAYASEMNSKLIISERTCSLCKQMYNFSGVFTRNQSTITRPYMKLKKARKPRPRKKKYAELLVVTDKSTTELKAKVLKLKPNDLKFLALTNLNLSELHKLKGLMKESRALEEHTYNNLAVIDNIPNNYSNFTATGSVSNAKVTADNLTVIDRVSSNYDSLSLGGSVSRRKATSDPTSDFSAESVISDIDLGKSVNNLSANMNELYLDIVNEDNIVSTKPGKVKNESILDALEHLPMVLPKNTFLPETIDEDNPELSEIDVIKEIKEEAKTISPRQSDTRARHEVLVRTLSAYIEVCSTLNVPQKALNAYLIQSNTKRVRPMRLRSINVYNSLLKGFAGMGKFTKMEEVLRYVKENDVELNVQSYAAIFECLGRINVQSNHLKHIRIYTKEAGRQNITFDRIINEAVFLKDQRAHVLKAMRAYDSSYIPKYTQPDVQYRNHLVDHLNNSEQLKPDFKGCRGEASKVFTKAGMEEKIQRQLENEKLGYVTVRSIEAKPKLTDEITKYREALAKHMKMWENSAFHAFCRDISALEAQKNHMNLEPYLKSIPTKDIINIIVEEAKHIAQGSETYSPTVTMLHRGMGNKVYTRYKALRKMKTGVLHKINKIHTKYCEDYVDTHCHLDVLPTHSENLNPRQKWQWFEHGLKSEGSNIDLDHQAWAPTVLQDIGKFLFNIVIHDILVDVNVMRGNSKTTNYLPAFYTIFRHQGRIVKEEVKPHPMLSKLYRASVPETLSFPSYEVPMICPPIPWCSVNTGGYLLTTSGMVRLSIFAHAQKQRMEEVAVNELYPSFDALNQLAAVPWMVNRKILDIILEVFNNGGSSKLDVPEPPSALTPPPSFTSEMDKGERYTIFRQKLQYRRKKAEMYSLWCDCLYRLSLANHFKDDIFWLPHNMDFRGRVYPVPPHLNHLGSDLARSMLIFAESRPLGPEGLSWLKLHLVNLTGKKKNDCVDDRLVYAEEIMDKIFDSADNPLAGKMWWAESDEPWQTLACCIEIAAAIRSGDAVNYRSHFPIHQDGSCNGLQHYAALGRDKAGAYSVNLTPASKPQDVYTAVAKLVEEKRMQDAVEYKNEIAKLLEGFVRRKVIKQTVMTTVYGVTRFGARLQIARQLKDIENFPRDQVWSASNYLTRRTFESLRTMFNSTREIQDWFTECARLISSVCGQNVEWVTPLGLPIVQPYFRYKAVKTKNGIETFHIDKYEKPNVMKQKNAFPPNFIHSLDSSHMMLTSLNCERAGLTFVSVHDCYWTHASTVHIMNKICREQFVALHSEPILENLSIFLSEKYAYNNIEELADDKASLAMAKKKLNKTLTKVPKTGSFDIREVLKSVYFFS